VWYKTLNFLPGAFPEDNKPWNQQRQPWFPNGMDFPTTDGTWVVLRIVIYDYYIWRDLGRSFPHNAHAVLQLGAIEFGAIWWTIVCHRAWQVSRRLQQLISASSPQRQSRQYKRCLGDADGNTLEGSIHILVRFLSIHHQKIVYSVRKAKTIPTGAIQVKAVSDYVTAGKARSAGTQRRPSSSLPGPFWTSNSDRS